MLRISCIYCLPILKFSKSSSSISENYILLFTNQWIISTIYTAWKVNLNHPNLGLYVLSFVETIFMKQYAPLSCPSRIQSLDNCPIRVSVTDKYQIQTSCEQEIQSNMYSTVRIYIFYIFGLNPKFWGQLMCLTTNNNCGDSFSVLLSYSNIYIKLKIQMCVLCRKVKCLQESQ